MLDQLDLLDPDRDLVGDGLGDVDGGSPLGDEDAEHLVASDKRHG